MKVAQARGAIAHAMIRGFLIVIAIGVVLLAAGALYLGMFPPNPAPHAVEKTLPNEKFQSR
jgi:hypothetical protein